MRPATHDDPNAIPRNGTDVPWLDLDDPSHSRTHSVRQHPQDGHAAASATEGRPRRR